MAIIRKFCCDDFFRIAHICLHGVGITVELSVFMTFMARWPGCLLVAQGPNKRIMGYIGGQVDGQGESCYTYISALFVLEQDESVHQKLATDLVNMLEKASGNMYEAYYVEILVPASSLLKVKTFIDLKYVICQRVLRFYTGKDDDCDGDDGLRMRKALPLDTLKKSMLPLKSPVRVEEFEF